MQDQIQLDEAFVDAALWVRSRTWMSMCGRTREKSPLHAFCTRMRARPSLT
jgi:hypothetical protein